MQAWTTPGLNFTWDPLWSELQLNWALELLAASLGHVSSVGHWEHEHLTNCCYSIDAPRIDIMPQPQLLLRTSAQGDCRMLPKPVL